MVLLVKMTDIHSLLVYHHYVYFLTASIGLSSLKFNISAVFKEKLTSGDAKKAKSLYEFSLTKT